MDRRIVAINNWVTARYFKKSDIETFFRNLEYFLKRDIKIHPSINISNPVKNRRTADVLFCSGVNEEEAKEKIGSEKLMLQYSWNAQYELNTVLEENVIICAMKSKDGASALFDSISQYIKDVTDSDVEMRGIK